MGDGKEEPRHDEHDDRLAHMGRTKAALREKTKSRKRAAAGAREPRDAFDQTNFGYVFDAATKDGSKAQHDACKNRDAGDLRVPCREIHGTQTQARGRVGRGIHHPRGADKKPQATGREPSPSRLTAAMSRSRLWILNSAGRYRDSAPSLGSAIPLRPGPGTSTFTAPPHSSEQHLVAHRGAAR